jgi:hypothetical protein
MAAASDSAPWGGPVARRWGHYGPTWIALSVAAVIAFGLNPVSLAPGSTLAVLFAIAAFALIGWRAMRQHDRRLCESCMMSMPLNPAEVASRHRLRFAVAHALVVKSVGLAYLAVVVGSDLVLLPGSLVERIAWAIIQSTMVYLVLAYSSHRRFQPWCPQCRGGHGDRDRDSDRGPAPLGQQSR